MAGTASDEGTPDGLAEVAVAQTAPEPRIAPPSIEEVEPPALQEIPIHEPPVAREDIAVADARGAWPMTGARRVRLPVSKALLRTATGGALLLFVCLAGLVLVGVASSSLRIDAASLEALSHAPSALLAVSLFSFGGAILLLGLLVWALRHGPK